jgi:fructose-1,6-bisphosphatase/inositol monophosphatase family enzyme
MNQEEITRFIGIMTPVVLDAGKFARESQGTVENLGKDDAGVSDADPEFVQNRARAKTIIDEQVQERILSEIKHAISIPLRIDAEEDTPSKEAMHTESAATTLVIDPIDGTLEYLEGKDDYSVCVALVGGGSVIAALVYFPMKEALYLLDADRVAYVCICKNGAIVQKNALQAPHGSAPDILFFNNRVPEEVITRLAGNFSAIRDIHGIVKWPEALKKCISGDYRAALFVRPQVRDVLIGAMIEAVPGGYALDFSGNKITWPDGGRIPEVVFGFGMLPEGIKSAMV